MSARLFGALLLVATAAPLAAPTVTPAPATGRKTAPSCSTLLSGFEEKIEQDYAGYRLEVKGERRRAYAAMADDLARQAASATGDACFFVLKRFVDWFHDPHLFVFQSTQLDSAESGRRARAARHVALTERQARSYFTERGDRLDPIEGIWHDGQGLRLAVVPDSAAPGRFMGIVLTPDMAPWKTGTVRATIERRGAGRYRVDLFGRNFALRHLAATIHKQVVLELAPGMWGKEFPALATRGLVDPGDAHRPTLVRDGSTVIVSVPSHDPRFAPVVDSLVSANGAALRSADRLIVDLRGNEGGSSWTTNSLLPFIRSRSERPSRYDGDTLVMLSSPDQIAYVLRGGFGPDTSAFARSLIRRLEASPGDFVRFSVDDDSSPADTVFPGSDRVGLITDGGTASAGEVLVLKALRSTRARVFGRPTAGALDYPSVNIVRVHPDESRWLLGYPTLAASIRLPKNGMRGKGIEPDVRIPVEGLWSTIEDVERRLGGGR